MADERANGLAERLYLSLRMPARGKFYENNPYRH